jgi:uncharacterized LabA/DUF88 family protein
MMSTPGGRFASPRKYDIYLKFSSSNGKGLGAAMAERLIMYVDGFNLYHGLHDWARCKWLWLDIVKLGELLRPRSDLIQVRYFTAPVLNDAGAASRQQAYQEALAINAAGRLEIVQGRYQTKTYTCRACGDTRRMYEEKETDVNIATSLVSDAALDRMDSALILSADSDLIPAVKAAKALAPKLFVTAAFPPRRNCDELKKVLPASFHVGKKQIRLAQLPETLHDPASGRTYSRPAKWS